jgi:hypothetical protein
MRYPGEVIWRSPYSPWRRGCCRGWFSANAVRTRLGRVLWRSRLVQRERSALAESTRHALGEELAVAQLCADAARIIQQRNPSDLPGVLVALSEQIELVRGELRCLIASLEG